MEDLLCWLCVGFSVLLVGVLGTVGAIGEKIARNADVQGIAGDIAREAGKSWLESILNGKSEDPDS